MKALSEDEWSEIESLRAKCFHGRGHRLSRAEEKLLARGLKESPEKYDAIGDKLRSDYKAMLSGEGTG